jgi:hypothetical protein
MIHTPLEKAHEAILLFVGQDFNEKWLSVQLFQLFATKTVMINSGIDSWAQYFQIAISFEQGNASSVVSAKVSTAHSAFADWTELSYG